MIGHAEYGWRFIGIDSNQCALEAANKIISSNTGLSDSIQIRLQPNSSNIFKNVFPSTEKFDFSICNPPFYSSMKKAQDNTKRKWKGLGKKLDNKRNFDGQEVELCYPGGEAAFISKMISESVLDEVRNNVLWYTTLVSKESNLDFIYRIFESDLRIMKWETIDINHGNKHSRIVAWTCQDQKSREKWMNQWKC